MVFGGSWWLVVVGGGWWWLVVIGGGDVDCGRSNPPQTETTEGSTGTAGSTAHAAPATLRESRQFRGHRVASEARIERSMLFHGCEA